MALPLVENDQVVAYATPVKPGGMDRVVIPPSEMERIQGKYDTQKALVSKSPGVFGIEVYVEEIPSPYPLIEAEPEGGIDQVMGDEHGISSDTHAVATMMRGESGFKVEDIGWDSILEEGEPGDFR